MLFRSLDESLGFVVLKTVNGVGVNINTASSSLLSYVSGLNKKVIKELIDTRDKKGKFKSREELLKVKGMTPKVYEQSIGFLRIVDGDNPLDKTSVHPESYEKVEKLLAYLNLSVNDLGSEKLIETLDKINEDEIIKKLDIDK